MKETEKKILSEAMSILGKRSSANMTKEQRIARAKKAGKSRKKLSTKTH